MVNISSTSETIPAVRLVRQPAREPLHDPHEVHVEASQGLAQLVVQLPGDGRALLLADVDQTRRQLLEALVRLAQHRLALVELRSIAVDGDVAGAAGLPSS